MAKSTIKPKEKITQREEARKAGKRAKSAAMVAKKK